MVNVVLNPAERAAKEAQNLIYACIDKGKSFIVEAGAGAGKTQCLIETLQHLIDKSKAELQRRHQQIACITYTNAAVNEIKSRTYSHPVILSSTIHSFCWSLIKNFQAQLREKLPELPKWKERLEEVGDISKRSIEYELGYPRAKEEEPNISLGHDDVISLTIALMEQPKFRNLFTARFPILLIDEYQDTNEEFVKALKTHFLDIRKGPIIGFFGDPWQKIYGDGCGKLDLPVLEVIKQKANFRSVPVIVGVLNRMREELPQEVIDPNAQGCVTVYHTNDWKGVRLNKRHWLGDLPRDDAQTFRKLVIERLEHENWSFDGGETKVLILTNKLLAEEQGYRSFFEVFHYTDAFLEKKDPHIAFLVDRVEPVCIAYEKKRFGEMFDALGERTPAIKSYADKIAWVKDMDELLKIRSKGTIGAIIDHLRKTERLRLPDAVERKEKELENVRPETTPDQSAHIEQLRKLRNISYSEVIALDKYIDGHTPFSTKHGVKGVGFENVLVIVGRGWDRYDFNQMLEWAGAGVPSGKEHIFERNRNLFYVVCSRAKKRLALLFTQELSSQALGTLSKWFGENNIKSIESTE